MITQILTIVQIIVSILLIGAILLQRRGSGLSAAFGGEGNVYRTRRGFEKLLLISTVILAVVFVGTAFVNLLV